MSNTRVFKMPFATVYPLYIQKAEKKGRTKAEVDTVICWLTGYNEQTLQQQINNKVDFETFFAQAPQINSLARICIRASYFLNPHVAYPQRFQKL